MSIKRVATLFAILTFALSVPLVSMHKSLKGFGSKKSTFLSKIAKPIKMQKREYTTYRKIFKTSQQPLLNPKFFAFAAATTLGSAAYAYSFWDEEYAHFRYEDQVQEEIMSEVQHKDVPCINNSPEEVCLKNEIDEKEEKSKLFSLIATKQRSCSTGKFILLAEDLGCSGTGQDTIAQVIASSVGTFGYNDLCWAVSRRITLSKSQKELIAQAIAHHAASIIDRMPLEHINYPDFEALLTLSDADTQVVLAKLLSNKYQSLHWSAKEKVKKNLR